MRSTVMNLKIQTKGVVIALILVFTLPIGTGRVAAQKPQQLKDAEKAATDAEHEAYLARGFAGGAQTTADAAPKTQADLDAEKAIKQAEKDEQAARDAQEKADASKAKVDANVPGSGKQATKDQQAADEAAKKAQESENAAEAAKKKADKEEKPDNPQKINREKQKKKRETAQKAWEKKRKLEQLKKELGLSLAPRPSEGPALAALVSDGKVKVDSVGTGETIGHIADLKIENVTDQPINCSVGPMVLESKSRNNQDYVCPKGETVEVPPHSQKTVPMDGVCIARNKPPVGKGVPGDLVVNDGNPNTPQDPNSHITPQNAQKLVHLCTSKYHAADKLLRDGQLKGIPYHDPQKQKDIVVQWSTWSDPQISEITGAPPATKDDLKKVVYKQLESKGPMSPDTKKKVDEGIDTIFEKVELTTAKAKELEPAEPQDYTQTTPPGSFEVSGDNETSPPPAGGPQTKEKKKQEPGPKKYPPDIQKWFDAWKAARDADYNKGAAETAYKKMLRDWCLQKSKHYKELKDARDKAKEKATAKGATQQDKNDLGNAQKELDKQEKELEKDFQKTDAGKEEFKKYSDAEKEANKANAAEREAGKNIDPDVKKAIIEKED